MPKSDEHPLEREPEHHNQPECGQCVQHGAVDAEPHRQADGGGDGHAPHEHWGVGQGPSGQNGASRYGQRGEPVDENLRQVLGNAGGRTLAGEQDDGGDEPWNQKVHMAEAAGADRRRPGGRSSSRNWAGEMLRVMKRYRDIARLSLGRIPMGPTLALTKEWVFELLRPVGIPDRIIGYLGDLMGLYIGAYAFEESLGLASPTGEVLPPHEIIALFRDYILSLPPDRFPHTLSAVDALFSGGPEERFEFGLDIVVRGLETYARPAGTHEGEPA
jgi:hypothetical protein